MYISYLLMAFAFSGLFITGLIGYLHTSYIGSNHIQFSIVSSILYMFTETLIMFYFIATGKNIKKFIIKNNLDINMYKVILRMKIKLFPHIMINMIIIGVVFMIGGAVHNSMINAWQHGLLFYIGFIHFSYLILIQHNCFKKNTELVISLDKMVKRNN